MGECKMLMKWAAPLCALGLTACISVESPVVGVKPSLDPAGFSFADMSETNAYLKAVLEEAKIVPQRGLFLSPDGALVIYYESKKSVDGDAQTGGWHAARVTQAGLVDIRRLPFPHDAYFFTQSTEWYDDHTFLYVLRSASSESPDGVYSLDIHTGAEALILAADRLGEGVRIGLSLALRPDRKAFAMLGEKAADKTIPRRGMAYEDYLADHERASIYIFDLENDAVAQATPDHHVVNGAFDWSPDGTRIAYAYKEFPEAEWGNYDTDIGVINAKTGETDDLLAQPGWDYNPFWSPDGRRIAVATQRGEPVYAWAWGGVVDLEGDNGPTPVYAAPAERSFRFVYWGARGDWFIGVEPHEFQRRLVRIDAATGASEPVRGVEDGLVFTSTHSYSFTDDGAFVFTRETPDTPQEIFISRLSEDGRSIEAPRRLTNYGADNTFVEIAEVERIDWLSDDGQFDVAGILISPKGAAEPAPLILNLIGGPSQVVAEYDSTTWPGLIPAAVHRGYAVFTPTSRGRPGFGDDFYAGIRTSGSGTAVPFRDSYGGVKELIRQGRADPDRIAAIGHSYGGVLTGYGLLEGDFAAAVIHDPGGLDRTQQITSPHALDAMKTLMRDFTGLHDPFSDEDQQRMISESPLWRLNEIDTPTLFHCAIAIGHRECEPMHKGLKHFGVPSYYFVYDDLHVFQSPQAQYYDALRTLHFVDYWMADDKK